MVIDLVRMAHCKASNLFVWTQQWTVQLNVVFVWTQQWTVQLNVVFVWTQQWTVQLNVVFVWTQQWTVQLNVAFLFTVYCKFSSRNRWPLLVQILQFCLSDIFLVFDKTNSVF